MRNLFLVLLGLSASTEALAVPSECAQFVGAVVVSDKGHYLGSLTNKYDTDSIFNKYGTYGSKYQPDSIWNKYGTYGSPYSMESAFDKYTSTPPLVINRERKVIALLSTNSSLAGAIDPTLLSIICFESHPDE